MLLNISAICSFFVFLESLKGVMLSWGRSFDMRCEGTETGGWFNCLMVQLSSLLIALSLHIYLCAFVRIMEIIETRYLTSSPSFDKCPAADRPEIAFIGRS